MPESGIDPATVRFEVGNCPYCKYSIFVRELVPLPPELSSCTVNILYKKNKRRRTGGGAFSRYTLHNRSAAINGFCCEGRCARDGKERARRLQRLFSGYERFREGRSAREGRSVRDARSDC